MKKAHEKQSCKESRQRLQIRVDGAPAEKLEHLAAKFGNLSLNQVACEILLAGINALNADSPLAFPIKFFTDQDN